jgi:hypothetical protein
MARSGIFIKETGGAGEAREATWGRGIVTLYREGNGGKTAEEGGEWAEGEGHGHRSKGERKGIRTNTERTVCSEIFVMIWGSRHATQFLMRGKLC